MDELINILYAMTCCCEALKGINRFYLYTVSETRDETMLIPVDEDNKKPLR